jgi:hypothetical protein
MDGGLVVVVVGKRCGWEVPRFAGGGWAGPEQEAMMSTITRPANLIHGRFM